MAEISLTPKLVMNNELQKTIDEKLPFLSHLTKDQKIEFILIFNNMYSSSFRNGVPIIETLKMASYIAQVALADKEVS